MNRPACVPGWGPRHVLTMLFVSLLVACAPADTAATQATLEGTYVRTVKGSRSIATISRQGDEFVIDLEGGASGDAGAAAAADCTVKASGPMTGERIVARFQSVRTDTMTYSKARAERERRTVTVVRSGDAVDVTAADVDGYCGVGADFVGHYGRTK